MSDHDPDGDSHMASSPEPDLDGDDDMFPESNLDPPAPSTPRQSSSYLPPVSELSPPNSQSRNFATGSTTSTGNTAAQVVFDMAGGSGSTNGVGASGSTTNPRAGGSTTVAAGQIKVHEPTGYQWIRQEEEPGYAWKNRKAQEEAMKMLDQVVDKERMIGAKFGDLLMERQLLNEKP
ncbi:hypothetical protein EV356DRAFT_515020 [Viridothelium virens]|uniref:Uncharacterized protein n=1 Tax=Viridothelium virens TaxID=1048519 RepID=A0A6A6H968_VIRVR|nr:hypothetical protein EV356DRAFT_515020 [Viridothelium virens]